MSEVPKPRIVWCSRAVSISMIGVVVPGRFGGRAEYGEAMSAVAGGFVDFDLLGGLGRGERSRKKGVHGRGRRVLAFDEEGHVVGGGGALAVANGEEEAVSAGGGGGFEFHSCRRWR